MTRKKNTSQISTDIEELKKMVVTVTIEELNKMIEKRAYEIYLERGGTHGDDMGDWYKAEREVVEKNP